MTEKEPLRCGRCNEEISIVFDSNNTQQEIITRQKVLVLLDELEKMIILIIEEDYKVKEMIKKEFIACQLRIKKGEGERR